MRSVPPPRDLAHARAPERLPLVPSCVSVQAGHLTLAGVALMVLGCWFGWPRPQHAQRGRDVGFSFVQAQTVFGLVVAFVGLVIWVIGVASHPVY